jgi:hypothetical protein
MAKDSLETMVKKLLEIEEIKKLHARYTFWVDERRWDEVVDLFAEDAIGEWAFGKAGSRGKHVGRKEIARFFKELVPKEASMFRHMVIQPVIEIDGERARAEWYMFGFGTYNLPEGATPAWMHGKYENELVKREGKWKFKHLKFVFTFQTPYHDGWVKRPSILPTVFIKEKK